MNKNIWALLVVSALTANVYAAEGRIDDGVPVPEEAAAGWNDDDHGAGVTLAAEAPAVDAREEGAPSPQRRNRDRRGGRGRRSREVSYAQQDAEESSNDSSGSEGGDDGAGVTPAAAPVNHAAAAAGAAAIARCDDSAQRNEGAPNVRSRAGYSPVNPAAAEVAKAQRSAPAADAREDGAGSRPVNPEAAAEAQDRHFTPAAPAQASGQQGGAPTNPSDSQGPAPAPTNPSDSHGRVDGDDTWKASFWNMWSHVYPSRMNPDKARANLYGFLSMQERDEGLNPGQRMNYRNAKANLDGRFKTVAGRALKVIGAWTLLRSIKSGLDRFASDDDEDDEEEDY